MLRAGKFLFRRRKRQIVRIGGVKSAVAVLFLVSATLASAQHRGGHGMAGNVPGAINRPDGVDERDSLADFHHALAVQATRQQIAEFQQLVKITGAAKDKLAAFASQNAKREAWDPFNQALSAARDASKKFQDGFSEPQKSGLKEITKRLEKSDSDLEQEVRHCEQAVESPSAAAEISARAAAVDKALADFSDQQLALGREMGITLASAEDVTFNVPILRTPVKIPGGPIEIRVASSLSQTNAEGDQRKFRLNTAVDLSDLEQSISPIMSAALDHGRTCGDRLFVRQATISSVAPASSVVLSLHFERWSCGLRASSATELGESEGSVEVKLTPAVDKSNTLTLVPEFKRVDATGMMAEELRSGDLGDDVRDKVAKAVLRAAQAGADFKTVLPAAVQNAATLESARFLDSGSGGMRMMLTGEIVLSNVQVNALAGELNRTLSAQGAPSPSTTATPVPTALTK